MNKLCNIVISLLLRYKAIIIQVSLKGNYGLKRRETDYFIKKITQNKRINQLKAAQLGLIDEGYA